MPSKCVVQHTPRTLDSIHHCLVVLINIRVQVQVQVWADHMPEPESTDRIAWELKHILAVEESA